MCKIDKWKKITEVVAFNIAKDQVQLYTVERDGFKNLLRVLDSRYKLSSRKHFGSVVLPAMYDTTRTRVTEQLNEVAFYSATIDLWSSWTMQRYMSLTVHFITDKGSLENLCLLSRGPHS